MFDVQDSPAERRQAETDKAKSAKGNRSERMQSKRVRISKTKKAGTKPWEIENSERRARKKALQVRLVGTSNKVRQAWERKGRTRTGPYLQYGVLADAISKKKKWCRYKGGRGG